MRLGTGKESEKSKFDFLSSPILPAEKRKNFVRKEGKDDDEDEECDEADESNVVGESVRDFSFERFDALHLFLPPSCDESFSFALNCDSLSFSYLEALGKDGFRRSFTSSFCDAMCSLQH